jgi:uncharacterized OB-fold protein
MAQWFENVEPLTLKGQIKVPYTWSVGEVGSRFLTALRDEQKFIGNRCTSCGTVFVPPRMNCAKCFNRINEWVEVGSVGVVEAFTIVREPSPLFPCDPPFAYVLITLDGATSGFLHIIKENLNALKKGARVKAKFAEDRTGTIRDIDGFTITG